MLSVNFYAASPVKCAYLNIYSQFLHLSHFGLLIVYPLGLVHGPHLEKQRDRWQHAPFEIRTGKDGYRVERCYIQVNEGLKFNSTFCIFFPLAWNTSDILFLDFP